MTVRVLVWNVEEFGTRYGSDVDAAVCDALRSALIAAVVQDANAQVLVLQELRSRGVGMLAALQNDLNAATGQVDWHFDWIPGSAPTGGAIPAPNFAALGFTAAGNQEGYAVLYRQGYVGAQAVARSAGQDTGLLGGGVGGNFIDLVVSGQPLAFNEAEPVIRFQAPPAATANLGFPQSTCPFANIERVTRKRTRDDAGAPYRSNDVIPLQYECRRPCQIEVIDAGAVGAPAFPLVVYHSPVGANASPSSYYGALIGFASAALQVAGDRAYAGDLNVVAAAQQGYLRGQAIALGYPSASQTWDPVTGAYRPTSVHAWIDNANWHTAAGVLTSARDYGFCTGTPVAELPPVLTWIGTAGTAVNNLLINPGTQAAVLGMALPKFAAQAPADAGQVVTAFYGGGAYPAGTDAGVAAALIFNLLLSDHLPVQIRRP
jgi:hypothetical protein